MKISFHWNKKDKSFGFLVEECLSKDEVNKLKGLDFGKIMSADREERLNLLTSVLDKDKAIWFNSRLEKDVILKNQKERLMDWVNNDKDIEPKWREEIIREISRLEKSLDDKEMDAFIEKLVELKLGVGVTLAEAQNITDLCKKMDDAKTKMENGGSKIDYETALKSLDDYIEMLKNS